MRTGIIISIAVMIIAGCTTTDAPQYRSWEATIGVEGGIIGAEDAVVVHIRPQTAREDTLVSVSESPAPRIELSNDFVVHEPYYSIQPIPLGEEEFAYLDATGEPISIFIPVPEDADTDRIMAAWLSSEYHSYATGSSIPAWEYLDGQYGPDIGYFVFRVFGASPDGSYFVLIETESARPRIQDIMVE